MNFGGDTVQSIAVGKGSLLAGCIAAANRKDSIKKERMVSVAAGRNGHRGSWLSFPG